LVEGKKMKFNYKFVNMNVMAFQDLLVLTFEKCSKFYGYINPLAIKQRKKGIFETFLTIKIKKQNYMFFFVFLNKGTSNVTFFF